MSTSTTTPSLSSAAPTATPISLSSTALAVSETTIYTSIPGKTTWDPISTSTRTISESARLLESQKPAQSTPPGPTSSSETAITTTGAQQSQTTPSTTLSTPNIGVPFENGFQNASTTSTILHASPTAASTIEIGSVTATPLKAHSKDTSVSAGAAAGIGIGTAILGALFTLAVILLLRRRRPKPIHHVDNFELGNPPFKYEQSSAGTIPFTIPHSANSTTIQEEHLLDRADDSHLKMLMQDLNEIIDQHCESYYHLQVVDMDPRSLQQRLVNASYNSLRGTGPSALDMAELVLNPNTRLNAIRRVIACIVLAHIDIHTSTQFSLLPPHISAFMQRAVAPRRESRLESGEIYAQSLKTWRRTTAFLLSPSRTTREGPQASEVELAPAIENNVQLINTILQPFIRPNAKSVQDQRDDLHGIVFETAKLGLLLFCQPEDWVFGWDGKPAWGNGRGTDSAASRHRKTVALPALGESVGAGRVRFVSEVVEVDI
ncbi:hypothetical protein BGZ60DRAFT_429178 [Tricladium varicosporioides]|nr:hypothetical protein BGZ60DRAFT_429178 [Hymenoscyphus varicosporioides]